MTTLNVTSQEVDDDYVGESIPLHVRIIFIIIGSLYTVIGVVGNIVIIVTIIITKTMRNPHFYFIVNLAVSDLLITGYVIPNLVVSFILGYYPVIDFHHCIFNGFVIVSAYVSSLVSLMVISINRYLSVCHSQIFSRVFSNKIVSSVVGCVAIWLLAFLSTLPCLFGWGRFTFDTKTHYCGYDRTHSFSYTLFLMLISIGIPVAVVFACNFAMWRFVRLASHRIYAMTQTQRHADNRKLTPGDAQRSNKPIPSSSKEGTGTIRAELPRGAKKETQEKRIEDNEKSSAKNKIDIVEIAENDTIGESNMTHSFKRSKMCPDINKSSTAEFHAGKSKDGEENDSVNTMTGKHKININDNFGGSTMVNKTDEMKYLRPWDGTTSSLIGVEIREMRNEVTTTHAQPSDVVNVNKSTGSTSDSLQTRKKETEKLKSDPAVPTKSHHKSRRDLNKSSDKDKTSGVLVTPDELALIKTIFIIFISFAVLMTPYMMSTLLDTSDNWASVVHIACSFTSFTNSCLNCLLYGLLTPAFKKAYRKLFDRCCGAISGRTGPKNRVTPHSTATATATNPNGPTTQSTLAPPLVSSSASQSN